MYQQTNPLCQLSDLQENAISFRLTNFLLLDKQNEVFIKFSTKINALFSYEYFMSAYHNHEFSMNVLLDYGQV